MPKTREQKAEIVERLTNAFQTGKSVAFADYHGMDVSNITDLRKKMHDQDVDYVVAKKTLLTRSAKEAGFDIDFSEMEGMIAVAFAHGDEMAPMKIIGDSGEELSIKLIGGIVDGQLVDAAYVNELAKLPSRSELLTQLLYMLNGPSGAFVRLLNAYREKQEEETGAAAEPAKEETPAAQEKQEPSEEEKPAAEKPAGAEAEQKEAQPEEKQDNSSTESKSE